MSFAIEVHCGLRAHADIFHICEFSVQGRPSLEANVSELRFVAEVVFFIVKGEFHIGAPSMIVFKGLDFYQIGEFVLNIIEVIG
jgi:hypothetical protein